MLNDYMGILNLNESERNIRSLTVNRPIASIPIYGRYRVIDFILSDMINCGINNVGIFIESNSRSLMDHVSNGKPWDLDRKIGGLFIFNFSMNNPYNNDVAMFKNNMEYLYRSQKNNVIMASSYMICNIDLEKAARVHEEQKNDITIVYKKVKNDGESFLNCDVLNLDSSGRVISVGKNSGGHNEANICTEIFIMNKKKLINIIYECFQTGYYSTIKKFIYRNLNKLKVGGYEFNGYLQCINSIRAYYKANMDVLKPDVRKELFFNNDRIYTKSKDMPPTKYSNKSSVSNSLVASGCIINGKVSNSIISRNVVIEDGAVIDNSIILQRCHIGKNVKLNKVILDKNVIVHDNKQLTGDDKYPLVIEKRNIVDSYNFKL